MAMHPKGQTGPPFAGLLLTCLFSCATGGPAARPSEVGGAPSPPRTAQLDGAPSEEPRSAKEAGGATPPQPAPHIIALPLEADELGAPPPLASVAPGEPPSPAYPAGTAYVARSQRDGNFVTEWDLARGSPRRRVGLHPAMQNLRIRRAGGALHVVGWAVEDGAMWYERLGLELAPGHAEFVAWADNEGLGALACDAQLAVVIVTGQIGPPEPRHDSAPLGIVGASFDEKGRTVVRRILRPDSSRDDEDGCHYRSNAVVIRGEVHLVVATQGCGPNKIITLDRQLEVQRQAVANELALEGEQPLSVSALSWGIDSSSRPSTSRRRSRRARETRPRRSRRRARQSARGLLAREIPIFTGTRCSMAASMHGWAANT